MTVNLYAAFPGVKDGLTLLTLLQDKKKLEAVLGVVKDLDDRITEINTAIEVYAKTDKIEILLRDTGLKNRDAAAALNEAVQESTKTKEDAKAWAAAHREKVIQLQTAVTERESELSKAKAEFQVKAEAGETEFKAREAAIAKNEQKAEGQLAQGTKLKERYEHALDALKTATAAA